MKQTFSGPQSLPRSLHSSGPLVSGDPSEARLFHAICLLLLFIVTSAASFSAFYQKWHFREPGVRGYDPGVALANLIDGTARRPYIYRQLLPDVANGLVHILPLDAISRHTPARAKERVRAAFNLDSKQYPVKYLIVYVLSYLAALGATFALYLVCRVSGLAPPLDAFSATIFMLLFPLFGVKGGYFFDYPELLFMAAAFLIALKFEWWWLVPVVALGTWNKESFLLFTMTLYPVLRRRYSRQVSIAATCLLVAVCATVYLPIRIHFAHNPGSTVEWHLREHLAFLLHPFALETWVDRTYDLMFPALSSPLGNLFLIWTVWRVWRFLPTWLQRHAQVAALINIPLYLLFCMAGEFRDLSLLYVSFLLIIATNLQRWAQRFNSADAQSAA